MGLEKNKGGNYLSIIKGDIRRQVAQETEGAIERDYETSDGKTGVKYELIYNKLSGKITSLGFYDSQYGKQLSIEITDKSKFVLQLNTSQTYCEDLMKKLPNIDLTKEVEFIPYDFEDDNGKRRQGITVLQDKVKIQNFFVEVTKDDKGKNIYKNVNGYPLPEGDIEDYDSDDWKAYYIGARKYTVNYINENIIPKVDSTVPSDTNKVEYPSEEINPDDIPF